MMLQFGYNYPSTTVKYSNELPIAVTKKNHINSDSYVILLAGYVVSKPENDIINEVHTYLRYCVCKREIFITYMTYKKLSNFVAYVLSSLFTNITIKISNIVVNIIDIPGNAFNILIEDSIIDTLCIGVNDVLRTTRVEIKRTIVDSLDIANRQMLIVYNSSINHIKNCGNISWLQNIESKMPDITNIIYKNNTINYYRK